MLGLSKMKEEINFEQIEQKINEIFFNVWKELINNKEKIDKYSKLFDRTSEEGFYISSEGPQGKGEQPNWEPNEAYMQSIEDMWKYISVYLDPIGLKINETLRCAFKKSREYKDTNIIHRRVFSGQLVEDSTNIPITSYMLTISHSHKNFQYVEQPYIQISRKLKIV